MHISISAEPIFHLGSFTVTNSMLVSWLVTAILCSLAIYVSKNIKTTKKPKGFQAFIEIVIEGLYGFVANVTGEAKAKFIFPIVATFFLFILLGNLFGLLPGVGTIGFTHHDDHGHESFVPLFRGATADINATLALAIISVGLTQYIGIRYLGLKYFSKFINFSSPMNFFIGILELISEFSKIVSFAFRLFGNIFAGEVLLVVMAFLAPFTAPIPFIGLEIFVGFVQALVFSMLTLVFMNLATVSHSEDH